MKMKKKKVEMSKKILVKTEPAVRLEFAIVSRARAAFLMASISLNLSSVVAAEKPELSINLSADKKMYHRKEEVIFTETIKNVSNNTAQIIDDQCGYGSDMKVVRASDHSECSRLDCSAGHTLKPGLRPGVRKFLATNESFTRKFTAYITDDLHLAFQNHGTAGFTGYSAGATRAKNLPEKFFGCGQVFDLAKPGQYQITATYSNNGDWSTGSAHPATPLWQGSAHSNTIELEVAH